MTAVLEAGRGVPPRAPESPAAHTQRGDIQGLRALAVSFVGPEED